jgi:hypothetical protein
MDIRLGPDWSTHATALSGLQMLGVITLDSGDAGALARTAAGVYVQVNGALVRDLDQPKVEEALAIAQSTNVLTFARRNAKT